MTGFESLRSHHKYTGIAQLGEHLVYAQGVGGSSPSVSTILHSSVGIRAQVFVSMGKLVTRYCLAIEIISSSLIGGPINLASLVRVQLQKPVAIVQLKRTPVYETGGREFKSLLPYQLA